jgi:hypothetical protein
VTGPGPPHSATPLPTGSPPRTALTGAHFCRSRSLYQLPLPHAVRTVASRRGIPLPSNQAAGSPAPLRVAEAGEERDGEGGGVAGPGCTFGSRRPGAALSPRQVAGPASAVLSGAPVPPTSAFPNLVLTALVLRPHCNRDT